MTRSVVSYRVGRGNDDWRGKCSTIIRQGLMAFNKQFPGVPQVPIVPTLKIRRVDDADSSEIKAATKSLASLDTQLFERVDQRAIAIHG